MVASTAPTSLRPQENGVAERMNRTIEDMALSFLKDAGLPKTYWGYAVPIRGLYWEQAVHLARSHFWLQSLAILSINEPISSCIDPVGAFLSPGMSISTREMGQKLKG